MGIGQDLEAAKAICLRDLIACQSSLWQANERISIYRRNFILHCVLFHIRLCGLRHVCG